MSGTTSRRQPAAALRAFAALLTLAGVTVGLPLLLYRLGGSPMPSRLPSLGHVASVLEHQDNGGLFLGAVRDVSWLAWAAFTLAVLAEAQAAVRGRRAPMLHLAGLQGIASRLVASATLLFSAPAAVAIAASPASAATVAATARTAPAAATARLAAAVMPAAERAANPLAAVRAIVVHLGDCLWTIADRYLGSGERYTEIVKLNLGNDMGNGQVFTDPSVILPGWRLHLPVSPKDHRPNGSDASEHHRAENDRSRHDGHPSGDPRFLRPHSGARRASSDMGKDAGSRGGGAPGGSTGAGSTGAGSTGSGSTGSGSTDPSVPTSGVTLGADQQTPADRHREIPQAALFTLGMVAGGALASLERLRHRQRQHRRPGRRIALPRDLAGRLVERKLRAAAASDPHAPLAPLSSPGPLTKARPGAPPATLPHALRHLSEGVAAGGEPLPPIVGIHLMTDSAEVLLSAPAVSPPPAPFTITPARQAMCWTVLLGGGEPDLDDDTPDNAAGLSADAGPISDVRPSPATGPSPAAGLSADAEASPATGPSPAAAPHPGHMPPAPGEVGDLLPGLFTAGATEAGGYLLLDLEATRVTCCDGPADLTDRLLVTAATELASSRWSGWYDLLMVGCDELEVLGRAELCGDFDDALDVLEARADTVARRLRDGGPADVRSRRLADPEDEDWGLALLVSRMQPTSAQMSRLLDLVEGPGGIAALVAGDAQAEDGRLAPALFQLAPDPEDPGEIIATVSLAYLGPESRITVFPQTVTIAEYEALAGIFETAAQTGDVDRQTPPYEDYGGPPWMRMAAAPVAGLDDAPLLRPAAYPDPADAESDDVDTPRQAPRHAAPSLQVNVLGQVEVLGSNEPLAAKQAELLLALALHTPIGLSSSALCTLLGADADHPRPADSVRQLITRTRRRLGQARDGQENIVHLGSGIYVLHADVRLDWASFSALVTRGRADRSTDDLRAALTMVRGQPFADCYHWWIDVALVETIRAEIIDAAELLATLDLAAGDPGSAASAARAGLSAEPTAEQLWRALMSAEHQAGNPAGVGAAWTGCLDAIAEIAPGADPHPDTERLFRRLSAGAAHFASA